MEFMKFSITEIRNNTAHQPYQFDGDVTVSDLALEANNDIRQIDCVHVNGFCTVDGDEIIISFTITGEMILPCARTLVDVPYSFSIDATEVFSTAEHVDDADKENGVHQITEEILDLTPYIKENIILETPYRVFSNEKALEKGAGWEFHLEDEHQQVQDEKIDPRLQKLQQLFDHDNPNKE